MLEMIKNRLDDFLVDFFGLQLDPNILNQLIHDHFFGIGLVLQNP
tara:strand:- start:327 stop:461 length:135 start_codon:yes stop_codon:yes gene_type:complete